MIAPRPFFTRRFTRWLFLTSALILSPIGAPAEDAASVDKGKPATHQSSLTPDDEAKLAKFTVKLGEARRKKFVESLEARIADLQKVTGLDDAGTKVLEGTVDAAADQLMAGWRETFPERVRESAEELYQLNIDNLFYQIEVSAGSPTDVQLDPDEAPIWAAALQRVLNPGQAAAWAQTVAERRETKLGNINVYLSRRIDADRPGWLDAMLKKTTRIKAALALSQEVADQLDDFSRRYTDGALQRLRDESTQRLMTFDEKQLSVALKGGGLDLPSSAERKAQDERAWEAGLAATLPAAELKRWNNLVEARRARRLRAYTGVLVSEMDRQLAFTAKQREQIEPLAARLIARVPHLSETEREPNVYYGNSSRGLYDAAALADDRDLRAILDADQVEQWHRACEAKRHTSNAIAFNSLANENASRYAEDSPLTPEELESRLSDLLQGHEESLRQEMLEEVTRKVDDASRSASLSSEKARLLQMAALGSAEALYENWKTGLEQNIRSSIADAMRAGKLAAELKNIGNYHYVWSGNTVDDTARWKRAVEMELTPAEGEAWKAEIEARGRYQDEAASRYVIARFDGAVDLSVDQWGKLEPIIGGIIKDYHEDISRRFAMASGQRPPWYLQYYGLLPFASLSDKDLEGLLTKEQIQAWTSSVDHSNCASMWQNLQRQHDQRVKQKK